MQFLFAIQRIDTGGVVAGFLQSLNPLEQWKQQLVIYIQVGKRRKKIG